MKGSTWDESSDEKQKNQLEIHINDINEGINLEFTQTKTTRSTWDPSNKKWKN
jgi:hypothetical protein